MEPTPAYRWLRQHFLRHPTLLPDLLSLTVGLPPPAAVTAEELGDELVVRAQGGQAPWYLLACQEAPDDEKPRAWPWRWLDLAEEHGELGWLVVLTDEAEVMTWLSGPAFRPPHGVGVLPLALDLSHHVETLRRPRDPRLTALSLWAARRRPPHRIEPVLDQLAEELLRRDDPLLAVPLLHGVLLLGEEVRRYFRDLQGRSRLRWPRWWAAAMAAL